MLILQRASISVARQTIRDLYTCTCKLQRCVVTYGRTCGCAATMVLQELKLAPEEEELLLDEELPLLLRLEYEEYDSTDILHLSSTLLLQV